MAAIAAMVVGLLLLITGIITGEVEVFLFLIFPVFRLSGILGLISLILFISGLAVLFVSYSIGSGEGAADKRDVRSSAHGRNSPRGHGQGDLSRWGGVVFIGPIPIVFGDRDTMGKLPKWGVLVLIGIGIMIAIFILLIMLLTIGNIG